MPLWSQRSGATLRFIQPGKPIQSARVESFNGKFRDALPDRFECFEAHAAVQGMNTDASDRTVIDRREHCGRVIIDRPGRHGIDAPHLVRPTGGDRAGMRLLRH